MAASPFSWRPTDFAADHRRLIANGVVFLEEPRQEPYGTVAVFEDLYGNRLGPDRAPSSPLRPGEVPPPLARARPPVHKPAAISMRGAGPPQACMRNDMTAFKPLVFSGVQPTGNLHLGNYLGAIRKFVALQDSNDCIYCVVDLHALTAQLVHEDLPAQIRSITAAFLASGIDPTKHIVFNQSAVPQHAELAWIFNCVARIGWMNRMTQFKDKAGKDRENASLGLLAYPSLMAADILVYRATHVPVGDDQKQHLELTRDIAQKFNIDFPAQSAATGSASTCMVGEETVHGYFPMVEPLIDGPAPRVMSLRDGTKKMSKSDPSDLSRINLTDDADTIAKKIRKAKTDPEALPSDVEGLRAARKPTISSASMPRLPTRRAKRCLPNSAASSFRSSSRRWPISRSRCSRRSPPRCAA